jgi:3'-phosphoadenosine 5'-phosphosulfate sulfotransferase (PAPS reductase)/FAD synthetase
MAKRVDLTGIEEAQKPIFYCGFGKDSSVVLHALKPYLDKVLVVFVDCGGVYPDVVEWADRIGATLPKYAHVHAPGDVFKDIREKGWPTDVEIDEIGELSDVLARDPLVKTNKVRLWTKCTHDRFWLPAFVYAQMYQPDLYISGEKRLDRPYATDADWQNRHMGAGRVLHPLMEWSDQDVWDYIDEHGIELPKTFVGRQEDRRDCYVCFGHNLSPERVRYLKEEYPDLYYKLFEEMGFKDVVSAMVRHLKKTTKVWSEIETML